MAALGHDIVVAIAKTRVERPDVAALVERADAAVDRTVDRGKQAADLRCVGDLRLRAFAALLDVIEAVERKCDRRHRGPAVHLRGVARRTEIDGVSRRHAGGAKSCDGRQCDDCFLEHDPCPCCAEPSVQGFCCWTEIISVQAEGASCFEAEHIRFVHLYHHDTYGGFRPA